MAPGYKSIPSFPSHEHYDRLKRVCYPLRIIPHPLVFHSPNIYLSIYNVVLRTTLLLLTTLSEAGTRNDYKFIFCNRKFYISYPKFREYDALFRKNIG